MRTYEQLTEEEQAKAREISMIDLLKSITEDGLRFNDQANGDDLQERIDKAIEEADRLQTPWFAAECVLEVCKEELEAMAIADSEDALYPDEDEYYIRLGSLMER